jgi:hypothetical protein
VNETDLPAVLPAGERRNRQNPTGLWGLACEKGGGRLLPPFSKETLLLFNVVSFDDMTRLRAWTILAPCKLPLFGETAIRASDFLSLEGGASVSGKGIFSRESRTYPVQNPKPVKQIKTV